MAPIAKTSIRTKKMASADTLSAAERHFLRKSLVNPIKSSSFAPSNPTTIHVERPADQGGMFILPSPMALPIKKNRKTCERTSSWSSVWTSPPQRTMPASWSTIWATPHTKHLKSISKYRSAWTVCVRRQFFAVKKEVKFNGIYRRRFLWIRRRALCQSH